MIMYMNIKKRVKNEMSTFLLDPTEEGLRKIHRDYEVLALHAVWNSSGGILSREIWNEVRKQMENPVSRSTIIKFLQEATDRGIIRYDLETCKGGHRRRYYTEMNEEEYREHIVRVVLESLLDDFPETKEVVQEIAQD